MSAPKTQHCDMCQHATSSEFGNFVCLKGHRPRFYQPRITTRYPWDDYGYKRRCEDFERKERAQGGAL